jgi:hypothetical protein
MRFKAKIDGLILLPHSEGLYENDSHFIFSKGIIYHPIKLKEFTGDIFMDKNFQSVLANDTEYKFEKNYDPRKEVVRFEALLNNRRIILKLNKWNKIKCNLIHNRYWFQIHKDFLFQTIIAASIGFLFSLIGIALGYHQGTKME